MSLDPLTLRTVARVVESAAVATVAGFPDIALDDAKLALDLLDGAIKREDYEGGKLSGSVLERLVSDTEPVFSAERDVRVSDDGEDRA